jgi:hypothetical protein
VHLRSRLLAASLSLALSASAFAHDFWIEPASHRPAVGSILPVHLFVGHAFEKEPYARNPAHAAEFVLADGEGRREVAGRAGEDPAGLVRIEREGTFVLGYRSSPSTVELDPQKFEAYLREKGLEHALHERHARGEDGKPGRESYSRCAKALLRTPGAEAGAPDLALGFPLELLLVDDPYERPLDAEGRAAPLTVRLLSEGRPLAGALLSFERLDFPEGTAPAAPTPAFTDERGQAALPIPPQGRWLVSAVEMRRLEPGGEQDWRSYWASLAFATGARAPEAAR